MNKKIKALFTEWAFEAHKLDPSKPSAEYFKMFEERYKKREFEKISAEPHFKDAPIET
jgi:hypothetical protein